MDTGWSTYFHSLSVSFDKQLLAGSKKSKISSVKVPLQMIIQVAALVLINLE